MQSNDARIIRGAAIPTAAAGVLAVAGSAVFGGADGAYSAAIGAAVAAAFFALGLWGLVQVGRRWPELFLGAGLMIYTTQIGVLMVLLLLLRDASFLNDRAFATGVLVAAVAWLAGQTRAHLTLKVPYVEPETSAAPARPAGDSTSTAAGGQP